MDEVIFVETPEGKIFRGEVEDNLAETARILIPGSPSRVFVIQLSGCHETEEEPYQLENKELLGLPIGLEIWSDEAIADLTNATIFQPDKPETQEESEHQFVGVNAFCPGCGYLLDGYLGQRETHIVSDHSDGSFTHICEQCVPHFTKPPIKGGPGYKHFGLATQVFGKKP